MSDKSITYAVFTKPWKMPLEELGAFVAGLGFEAIELPVRPGYQVPPEEVHKLPQAARLLAQSGIKIASVAGPLDEATIRACAEAGIPIIRTMAVIGPEGYRATLSRLQAQYDALIPLLERYGVKIGVQNHCDHLVANAEGLLHLLGRYDPEHIGIVWDAAHEALNGIEPELALELVWDRLRMVNFKNAFWQRINGPEAEFAQWKPYWTTGRHGLASWPRVAAELKRRNYRGLVCLTAEYSDERAVNRLIAEDIAFAKTLLA